MLKEHIIGFRHVQSRDSSIFEPLPPSVSFFEGNSLQMKSPKAAPHSELTTRNTNPTAAGFREPTNPTPGLASASSIRNEISDGYDHANAARNEVGADYYDDEDRASYGQGSDYRWIKEYMSPRLVNRLKHQVEATGRNNRSKQQVEVTGCNNRLKQQVKATG